MQKYYRFSFLGTVFFLEQATLKLEVPLVQHLEVDSFVDFAPMLKIPGSFFINKQYRGPKANRWRGVVSECNWLFFSIVQSP